MNFIKRPDDSAIKGFFAGWLVASLLLLQCVYLPDHPAFHVLSVVVVPFLIFGVLTKDFLVSLTLVAVNEMFFGVGGLWVTIGPINGRAMLLAVLMGAYLMSSPDTKISGRAFPARGRKVLGYAILFPALCLGFAVGIKHNPFGGAMSDLMRFAGLLLYFPLLYAFDKKPMTMIGCIVAMSWMLGGCYAAMAYGDLSLRYALIEKWIYAFSPVELKIEAVIAMERTFFTPLMLCFIALFYGLFLRLGRNFRFYWYIPMFYLLATGVAALVLNSARGPLAALALLILFIILLLFLSGRVVFATVMCICVVSAGIGSFVFASEHLVAAQSKLDIGGASFVDIVDPVRVEQVQYMMREWLREPLFGQGVGASIQGYARDESGLAFEVQYPMMLYRLGLIGFVVLMAPVLYVSWSIMRRAWKTRLRLENPLAMFLMATGFSLLTLLLASWVNPYFASAMTPMLFAMYLAVDAVLKSAESHHPVHGPR